MYIHLQSAVNFVSDSVHLTNANNIVLAIYYNKNMHSVISLPYVSSIWKGKERMERILNIW